MSRLTLICGVMALMAGAAAQDQVLVSETFDTYSTSTLTTTASIGAGNTFGGGTGWKSDEGWFLQNVTGSGGGMVTSSDGVGLETDGSSGGATGFISRQFASTYTSTTGAPVWMSFWLQGTDLQGVASAATAHNAIELHNASYSTNLSFSLTTSGNRTTSPAGKVRWSILGVDDPATADKPADDLLHFVVCEIAGTTATVWFDPALGSTPPVIPFTTTTITPLSFDRIIITGENNCHLAIDDLRLGNTWLAVTSQTIPWVTGLTPIKGTTDGHTTVTFTGRNFGSSTTAQFNNVAGTSPSALGTTSLSVLTPPAGAPATVGVEVFNGTESVVIPNAFTYVAPSASFPSNQIPPAILGDLKPGNTVTATPGTWTPTTTDFHYVWEVATDAAGSNAGTAPDSADSTSYAITDDVLSKFMRVKVTANGADPASAAYSDWMAVENPKPTAQELSAMEAVGPKCGGGAGLAALALSPLLLLLRRRRA